jgi:choline dehydrogenase
VIEADYLIIGAGMAGCLLADRLSEDGSAKVLLVEAESRPGGPVRGPMLYFRGFAADYDDWGQRGLGGWSHADLLPFFLREEDFVKGADPFHAVRSRLGVARPHHEDRMGRAFLLAAMQAGFRLNRDFNGADPAGIGFFHEAMRGGRPLDSAAVHLATARKRANLRVLTSARVVDLRFVAGRCTGALLANGKALTARREVILCAGAEGSPWLLLRSGLGPVEALAAHGIAVRQALPGVGQGLQDHPVARLRFAARKRGFRDRLRGLLPPWRQPVPTRAGGFLGTRRGLDRPDLQCLILAGPGGGCVVEARLLGARSRGQVGLSGPLPTDPPRVEPALLAEPADVATLREAVKLLRRITGEAAFARLRGAELAPGPGVPEDRDIEAWLPGVAEPAGHRAGTCAMGTDPAAGAVTDAQLRVFGVAGLRIADASAMPTLPGGGAFAPVMMLAEKAAAMIRGKAKA